MSDGAWSDEDGLWDTAQGAALVDDISINGGSTENWEGEACGALQSADGVWVATIPPGFGIYAASRVTGPPFVQEDPCVRRSRRLWGFFDDPAVTNYACGGWPLQGAMPYGPDENGLYLDNEIWSPWFPLPGPGTSIFSHFSPIATSRSTTCSSTSGTFERRDNDSGGCPTDWDDLNFVYYGGQKDWIRTGFQIGAFMSARRR